MNDVTIEQSFSKKPSEVEENQHSVESFSSGEILGDCPVLCASGLRVFSPALGLFFRCCVRLCEGSSFPPIGRFYGEQNKPQIYNNTDYLNESPDSITTGSNNPFAVDVDY